MTRAARHAGRGRPSSAISARPPSPHPTGSRPRPGSSTSPSPSGSPTRCGPSVFVELGTHHGTSYFAFCQELRRAGTARRGPMPSTPGRATSTPASTARKSGRRSTITTAPPSPTSRPSTARPSRTRSAASPTGSVDLLHIDGLHSFEAVSADFESWLPKMSRRGVVVLHDSQVRERGFGVYRLVADLRRRLPLFEFAHGHGLAVVGVGRDLPPALRALLAAEAEPKAKTAIEALFARLGRACLLELKRRHPPPGPRPPRPRARRRPEGDPRPDGRGAVPRSRGGDFRLGSLRPRLVRGAGAGPRALRDRPGPALRPLRPAPRDRPRFGLRRRLVSGQQPGRSGRGGKPARPLRSSTAVARDARRETGIFSSRALPTKP